ncbi:MerC family mercury resistance protein [Cupriavidus plantarum]
MLGSIASAMGCASCFPAIASLGAAVGLGFLSQYKGLFIRILLPAFAVMMAVSIWDLFSPARRVCTTDTCDSGPTNMRKV